MKKITILLCASLFTGTISAQPDVKKAAKSVFTIKSFAADGSLLTSSNGFFIDEKGAAISSYTPFRNAAKAVIIDTQGKEYPVECMLGANEMYDVTKFKVSIKRSVPLPIASAPVKEGDKLWLIPYSAKKTPESKSGIIEKAEKFQTDYDYYTITLAAPGNTVSCPFLNDRGEVVGMMQKPVKANSPTSYAISAKFGSDMKMTGLSINDPALRGINIKKDLPDDIDQAILTLYITGTADSARYAQVVEDFIAKFPQAPDGYVARAQLESNANKFGAAAADMEQALKVAAKKDDVHYNYARLIFQKELYKNHLPYADWNLDKALGEAVAAYGINQVPAYQQLQGQILFAQKKYDEAFNKYIELANGGQKQAEIYYEAARCKEMLNDSTAMLAMLDSAVNTFTKPYLKAAAPYLFTRAQAYVKAGKYRQAILDYNDYESLMSAQLNDNFYYLRYQTEMAGHLYQQALNDISKAISKAPGNAVYHAEKAALELRVGHYGDAAVTAAECIRIDPALSDGYLFLGYAQCLQGKKAEGIKNLQKAKELGDGQAQGLIDKYSK